MQSELKHEVLHHRQLLTLQFTLYNHISFEWLKIRGALTINCLYFELFVSWYW